MPTRLFLLLVPLAFVAVLLPTASTQQPNAPTPEPKEFMPSADKMPVSQALAELAKQTGIAVADVRGAADETIHLERKRVSFWHALDSIAAAAKARVTLYPSSGRIVLNQRGANYRVPPISYDGRFRLSVKKVTTSRDLETRAGAAHAGSTNLAVEVAWDPELLPLYLETRPRGLRLVDDRNNVQTIPDEGSALAPVDGLIALNIDVTLPALPRSVNTIRSLEGQLMMIGPSKMLTFMFDRLDRLAAAAANDPERRLQQENVTCRILDVKLLRDRWTVRLALDYPPSLKQLDSNQSWVVNNELTLESQDGKKHFAAAGYYLESATTRQAILSYHFLDKGTATRGKAAAWRLRYRAPANLIEMPIKFAFKDVELP